MLSDAEGEVVAACQKLLACIDARDWKTYAELCDASLTAFEPEARGHLVTGLEFHRFYFDMESPPGARQQSSISSPDVRIAGDVAIVCYTRLVQSIDSSGADSVRAVNETRVWQRQAGRWRHVHFHRSPGH